MPESKHHELWKKTIIRVASYEDVESNNVEALTRAAKSTGMDHAKVRETNDPTELGMECRGEASIHASSKGECMTMDAEQIELGVAHGASSGVASDLETINSPDGMALVQVVDAPPSRDLLAQL